MLDEPLLDPFVDDPDDDDPGDADPLDDDPEDDDDPLVDDPEDEPESLDLVAVVPDSFAATLPGSDDPDEPASDLSPAPATAPAAPALESVR